MNFTENSADDIKAGRPERYYDYVYKTYGKAFRSGSVEGLETFREPYREFSRSETSAARFCSSRNSSRCSPLRPGATYCWNFWQNGRRWSGAVRKRTRCARRSFSNRRRPSDSFEGLCVTEPDERSPQLPIKRRWPWGCSGPRPTGGVVACAYRDMTYEGGFRADLCSLERAAMIGTFSA